MIKMWMNFISNIETKFGQISYLVGDSSSNNLRVFYVFVVHLELYFPLVIIMNVIYDVLTTFYELLCNWLR